MSIPEVSKPYLTKLALRTKNSPKNDFFGGDVLKAVEFVCRFKSLGYPSFDDFLEDFEEEDTPYDKEKMQRFYDALDVNFQLNAPDKNFPIKDPSDILDRFERYRDVKIGKLKRLDVHGHNVLYSIEGDDTRLVKQIRIHTDDVKRDGQMEIYKTALISEMFPELKTPKIYSAWTWGETPCCLVEKVEHDFTFSRYMLDTDAGDELELFVWNIVMQVFCQLHIMRDVGFTHYDLIASNILLQETDEPVVYTINGKKYESDCGYRAILIDFERSRFKHGKRVLSYKGIKSIDDSYNPLHDVGMLDDDIRSHIGTHLIADFFDLTFKYSGDEDVEDRKVLTKGDFDFAEAVKKIADHISTLEESLPSSDTDEDE